MSQPKLLRASLIILLQKHCLFFRIGARKKYRNGLYLQMHIRDQPVARQLTKRFASITTSFSTHCTAARSRDTTIAQNILAHVHPTKLQLIDSAFFARIHIAKIAIVLMRTPPKSQLHVADPRTSNGRTESANDNNKIDL